jgi:hypothetical protein
MKKNVLPLILIVLATTMVWLLLRSHPLSTAIPPAAIQSPKPAAGQPAPAGAPSGTNALSAKIDGKDAADDAAYTTKRERERLERIAQADRDYNTTIVFYGRVLDQFDQPVPKAAVEYASVDGSFEGDRTLIADPAGNFTISGIQGKHLRVRVSHAEYYNADAGSSYYYYAGKDRPLHVPQADRPEIFRLRKKGEAAELVRLESHVLFNGDEPERSFSFYDHSRRRDQPDYVVLKRVETAVPEGGIRQRTDSFAFIAPEVGYQPAMYFTRPQYGGQLDYFVKFNNGNYGRFTIRGSSGDYLIDSYLNPDKSPNLEYDQKKEITFVQTGKMGIDLLYPAKKEVPAKP